MATHSDPVTTVSDPNEQLQELHAEERLGAPVSAGTGPWRLAWRRMRRNKVSLMFGLIFLLLVASAVLAPVWSNQVAKTSPNTNHLSDTITIDGEQKNVVEFDGVPIGPQFMKADGKFFL